VTLRKVYDVTSMHSMCGVFSCVYALCAVCAVYAVRACFRWRGWQMHAERAGISTEKLESARVAMSRDSPMWQTLDHCITQVQYSTVQYSPVQCSTIRIALCTLLYII